MSKTLIIILLLYLLLGRFVSAQDQIKAVGDSLKEDNGVGLNYIIEIEKHLISTNLGYLGITITIILSMLGLAGLFFYLFNFKPLKDRLDKNEEQIEKAKEKTKEEIKNWAVNELNKQIGKSREELIIVLNQKFQEKEKTIDKFQSNLISNFNNRMLSFEADLARTLALHSENFKWYNHAFFWSLEAAYKFYKINENDLCLTFLKAAEDNLKQWIDSSDFDDVDFIDKNLKNIKENIGFLKSKYEIRIEVIEKLLNEKIEKIKSLKSIPFKSNK